MPSVNDIKIDELPLMRNARGILAVVEFGKFVPFTVVRLFYMRDVPPAAIRGEHAHHRCRQYMICQNGRVRVDLADGKDMRCLELSPGQAVLIEPGIFATETYLDPESMILVLCDRPYEKEDYIHTMDEFLRIVRQQG